MYFLYIADTWSGNLSKQVIEWTSSHVVSTYFLLSLLPAQ